MAAPADKNGMLPLDAPQVIRTTARRTESGALGVGTVVLNSLVPSEFDQISLTYVIAGNGTGEIETVLYSLASVLVATLTLSYDASNNLIDVVRS